MVAATSRVTYFHTLDTPNNHFYKKMVVSPNIRQTQVVQTLLANQDFMESKKSLDHCSPVKQRYLYDGWRFFLGGTLGGSSQLVRTMDFGHLEGVRSNPILRRLMITMVINHWTIHRDDRPRVPCCRTLEPNWGLFVTLEEAEPPGGKKTNREKQRKINPQKSRSSYKVGSYYVYVYIYSYKWVKFYSPHKWPKILWVLLGVISPGNEWSYGPLLITVFWMFFGPTL